MEADWCVEIGPESPWIAVPWRDAASGLQFIDLRQSPQAIGQIAEAAQFSPLAAALLLLNSPESRAFTSKCDAWRMAADELDAMLESVDGNLDTDLKVRASEAQWGMAAYIDVVLREAIDFASFALHERWLRRLTGQLRTMPFQGTQVEFTLRWAQVDDHEGFATTLHIRAAGRDEASALRVWGSALNAAAALVARGPGAADLPARLAATKASPGTGRLTLE